MKRFYFCLSLLLCHYSLSYGFRKETSLFQSIPLTATVPLAEALKDLGKLYKVNFLYEQTTVNQKKVVLNKTELKGKKIEEILTGLLTPLKLGWYKIDEKNYSVYPLDKSQKSNSSNTEHNNSISNQPAIDTLTNARIIGRVMDEFKKPLEYVTLTLRRTVDSSFVMNALSDSAGRYQFAGIKMGDYKIKLSVLGYIQLTTASFNLNSKDRLTIPAIALKPLSETLSEVRITASRPLVETKSDRLIMNIENSAMATGNSLQLLKSAPFVRISADNNITLQGKRTMILIDNKPVPDASLQDILQTLPSGNISKVELITQPSAKYDATYGAVINITTKKSTIEGVTGNVRAEGSMGLYGKADLNSSLTFKRKNLTLFGTAGINKSDNLFRVNTERILGNGDSPDILTSDLNRLADTKLYNFQTGADLAIDKNQTIGLLINGNSLRANGPWTTTDKFSKQGAGIDSILNTNTNFNLKLSTYTYNLNYHLTTDSGKNELSVLATFTPFRRNLFQYFPSELLNSSGEVIRTPPVYQTVNTSHINVYIAQIDYKRNLNQQWTLETGLKYQKTDSKSTVDYEINKNNQFENDPAYSNNSRLSEIIAGAYGILSKDWKNDKLQLGFRVENTRAVFKGFFNQNYFNAFPSFLYQHTFNENYNLSFSFKRAIARAPYYDLVPYTVFVNKYTIEQGNPSLKPEYDNIYTISTNIHKLNLSLSYTSAKDMIAMLPNSQDYATKITYFSRQNLSKSSDLSFNLFYPLRINSWWETQNSGNILGYTKVQGQVLGSSYLLSSVHSDFRSAQIFKLSQNIKLQVDAYFWTRYTQDLSKYSGYKNIDASLLLDIMSGKGQVRLSGNEIIFKRNDYYQNNDFGMYRSHNIYNSDSRRVSIGFTYKFGKNKFSSPEKKAGNEDALKRL